jgi:hypothetical protein
MTGFPVRRRYAKDDGPSHSRLETDDFFNLFVTDAPYTQIADDLGTPNIVYLAQAAPGNLLNTAQPIWRIRMFTYSANGNIATTAWAGTDATGYGRFDQVYDNRAALVYK